MLERKLSAFFLGILALIAVGVVFKIASTVIMPIVIALLFSFILYPLIMAMEKVKIPNIFGIIIVLSVLSGAFYLIIMLLYRSLTTLTLHIPWYLEQLTWIYRDITQRLMTDEFPILSSDFILDYDWGRVVRGYLITLTNSITRFAGYSFAIFIFLLFLFLEFPVFKDNLSKASPKLKKRVIIGISRITRGVGKYLAVKAFISAITGVLTWIVLSIIGLDFAMLWGLMAFFLNFIPYVGSIIAVLCIILQAVVQFYPSFGMVLLVAITMLALQQTLGNIIDPKLQGDRLNLSITVIIFSLSFWGWLWGPVGAVLAIPITVAIKTICLSISFLKPVGIMMGKDHKQKKRASKKQETENSKIENNETEKSQQQGPDS
ncbi:MAG: AI-2E family transporter [Spirochaetaceae bacterium]|nr:AI-2E family transporter [Spirochaetaceae bacterium]